MVVEAQAGRVSCRGGLIVEPPRSRIAGDFRVEDDRERLAAELARVREEARAQAREPRTDEARPTSGEDAPPGDAPSAPLREEPAAGGPSRAAQPAPPAIGPLPRPPSAREVNETWRAEPGRSPAGALLERVFSRHLRAQRDWNAAQVRLDNDLLRWMEERFAATHAHYDALLGALGRRLDEADERHARLEDELVRHVRELLRRLELTAAESSRGRAAFELQLEDLRAVLARLERARDPRA
jgi:hypothetical protein